MNGRISEKIARNAQEWCECPKDPKPHPSFCVKNCALVNGSHNSNPEFNQKRIDFRNKK